MTYILIYSYQISHIYGCVHKLIPDNPGYDTAVHKLITETGSTVYEHLVLNPEH